MERALCVSPVWVVADRLATENSAWRTVFSFSVFLKPKGVGGGVLS